MIITVDYIVMFITITGVLAVLGAIAIFMHAMLKKEHEFQEKEKGVFKDYQAIIDKAHVEAQEVLEDTSEAAQRVLSQTRSTNENLAGDLDKVLQHIAQKHIELLNSQATTLNQAYEKKVVDLLQTVQDQFIKELDEKTESLVSKATTSEDLIDEKTKEMLAKAEAEIAEYKKAQMAKVEEQISHVVEKTYQDILQRSIPADVQHDLIIEALEKAKKEGTFEV